MKHNMKELPKHYNRISCPDCEAIDWEIYGNKIKTFFYFRCKACGSVYRNISPRGHRLTIARDSKGERRWKNVKNVD